MVKRAMSESGMACSPCGTGTCASLGWILLIVGIVYLLQDLGALQRWGLNWPLQWWTVGFLLLGAKKLLSCASR